MPARCEAAPLRASRWLLQGRSENVKQVLSRGVLEALEATLGTPDGLDAQLSVQLQDKERSTYTKALF